MRQNTFFANIFDLDRAIASKWNQIFPISNMVRFYQLKDSKSNEPCVKIPFFADIFYLIAKNGV